MDLQTEVDQAQRALQGFGTDEMPLFERIGLMRDAITEHATKRDEYQRTMTEMSARNAGLEQKHRDRTAAVVEGARQLKIELDKMIASIEGEVE